MRRGRNLFRVGSETMHAHGVIDCNAALGRRHDRRVLYDRPEDLLRIMDEARIARALVYHPYGIWTGSTDGNRFLLESIEGQDRLVPQFVVSLATDDMDRVRREAADAGVRSLRVVPISHGYPFVHWVADPWLEWMAREGLALWIPMGRDAEVDPRDLYDTASRHPDVPIVLAGLYYTDYPSIWPLLRALDHVHVDLSRWDLVGGLERLVDHIGAERILFGSDFPEVDGRSILYQLAHCGLREEQLAAIHHGNIERLLGMDE